MSHKNTISENTRCLGANATLSNISVCHPIESNTNDLLAELKPVWPNTSPNGDSTKPQRVKQNMTKNTPPTTPVEDQNKDKKSQVKEPKSRANKGSISKLSVIAIGLTICLGGFLYFNSYQQATRQQETIAQLKTEIGTLKETLQQSITDEIKASIKEKITAQNAQLTELDQEVKKQLSTQAQTQQQFINKVDDAIKVSEQNIFNFNERLSAMSTTDNKIWLISQANYLVNLAGRKIWNDQDYTTARLLLKTADASLAQANDPSLLPARQSISKDITNLGAISFTDFDGIVLTLMELVDSVTELPLVDHYKDIDLGMTEHDDSIPDSTNTNITSLDESNSAQTTDSNEISSSLSDWYTNMSKSAKSFFAQFIQVEKYDTFGECIASADDNEELLKKCQAHTAVIMPEQALYLRENIKLRLLIAAQAVPRHQEHIYQQALNDVAVWVNAYFDVNSASVKVFLSELDNLQKQSISNQNVPEQLKSQDELSKLMQTRVRAMLTE